MAAVGEEPVSLTPKEAHFVATQQLIRNQLSSAETLKHSKPMSAHERRIFGSMLPNSSANLDKSHRPMQRLLQPSVSSTMNAYLRAMQTFVSKDQLLNTTRCVEDFLQPGGMGEQVSKSLDAGDANNFERLNLDRRLERRHSLFLNGNPAVLLQPDPVADRNVQLEVTARLVSAMLSFKAQVDDDKVPAEKNGKQPCTMHSYPTMFNHTQIPGAAKDVLAQHLRTTHLCVSTNNAWWHFDAFHPKDGKPLTTREVEETLTAIVDAQPPWATQTVEEMLQTVKKIAVDAPGADAPPAATGSRRATVAGAVPPGSAPALSEGGSRPSTSGKQQVSAGTCLALLSGEDPSPSVGALTWLPREKWAQARKVMNESPTTASSLKCIESGVFNVVLSPECPEPGSMEALRAVVHGSGRDRWLDKSLTLVVCANGVAGLTGNATVFDHAQLHSLASRIWQAAIEDDSVAADRLASVSRAERRQQYFEEKRKLEEERRQEEERLQEIERQRQLEEENDKSKKGGKKEKKISPTLRRGSNASHASGGSDHADIRISAVAVAGYNQEEIDELMQEDFSTRPVLLEWDLSPEIREQIRAAERYCDRLFSKGEVEEFSIELGDRKLRAAKVSPLAFVQLAIQMAYYKVHGRPSVVVQAVNMAGMRHGRVQYVPTVTRLSTTFCKAACGLATHAHSVQDMNCLLGNAAAEQTHLLETAQGSLSWHSHLMALDQASQQILHQEALAGEVHRWFSKGEEEAAARKQARIIAREQRAELNRLLEEERVRDAESAAAANTKGKAAPKKDAKGGKGAKDAAPAAPEPVPEEPEERVNPHDLFPPGFDEVLSKPPPAGSPRNTTKQSLGVGPCPLFADESFAVLSAPVVTNFSLPASRAVATMVCTPTPVKQGISIVYSVDAHTTKLAMFSYGSAAGELDKFQKALHESIETMYVDYVLRGKPTSAAILAKANGGRNLVMKQHPSRPLSSPKTWNSFEAQGEAFPLPPVTSSPRSARLR